MLKLSLIDHGTRHTLFKEELNTKTRLGRGCFSAVYDNEDGTVEKLSIDSVSFEGHRDYYHSPHLPKMLHNSGIVGLQLNGAASLYRYRLKKLQPLKFADKTTKKLARKVISIYSSARSGYAHKVLRAMAEAPDLPFEIRTAFEELYLMATNFNNLMVDLHSGNLMVDGTDHLVINDAIGDSNNFQH